MDLNFSIKYIYINYRSRKIYTELTLNKKLLKKKYYILCFTNSILLSIFIF